MTFDDKGEGGIQNDQKTDDVICGRPPSLYLQFLHVEMAVHIGAWWTRVNGCTCAVHLQR